MKVVTSESGQKGARKFETDYDFGSDLKDAGKKHGDKNVYDVYLRGAKVDLQGFVRRLMKAGKTDKEITKLIADEWKPGVKASRGKSAFEKATDAFAKLTDEEKASLQKKLGL